MEGIDPETGQPIGRAEHIAQSVDLLLKVPRGARMRGPGFGVDYLSEDGRPLAGLAPAKVEASAHAVLHWYEPRIRVTAITAHFEGDVLDHVRIAWRDAEDSSEHEVTVSYET